jgi:hypothetical protein
MMSDDLLVNYLLGEASPTEAKLVEDWLAQSQANNKRLSDLKLIWDQSKYIAPATTVNVDDAWARFKLLTQEAQPVSRTLTLSPSWSRSLRAAAVLVLLAVGGYTTYLLQSNPAQERNAVSEVSPPEGTTSQNENVPVAITNEIIAPKPKEEIKPTEEVVVAVKDNTPVVKKNYLTSLGADCGAKEFICNGTPCPLEICIYQKSSCNKDQPYAVSNCSILQPDQSGQLCYKAFDDDFYRNCAMTVEEVRIKRVTTGETIVLTAHSSPLTAQEFIYYVTGEKEGDVIAGVFQEDCNSNYNEHGLRMDNSFGAIHFR